MATNNAEPGAIMEDKDLEEFDKKMKSLDARMDKLGQVAEEIRTRLENIEEHERRLIDLEETEVQKLDRLIELKLDELRIEKENLAQKAGKINEKLKSEKELDDEQKKDQ